MGTGRAGATAVSLLLLCCTLCAAELEPAANSAEAPPKVAVVGDVPARPELEAVSGVSAWVVNGQEISIELVRERAAAWHGTAVLQHLVAELLLEQEADRRDIIVTDEEVNQKVASLREELGVRSEVALDSYLRAKLATRDWLRAKARFQVLMEKVLSEQIYVDDREIERAYRLNRELYSRGELLAFRIMRFLDKASADAALAEIRKGRSFQEVAKETAPTAAERAVAGDLQYYERSQQSLPPELAAALFAAPLNQVAGPVEVLDSYCLIRVEKKLDPRQFTLDEVREVVREQLERQKLERVVWPNWVADQLQRAQIEVLTSDATSEAPPGATSE
jgi:foldase protein PrsA